MSTKPIKPLQTNRRRPSKCDGCEKRIGCVVYMSNTASSIIVTGCPNYKSEKELVR